MKLTKRLPYIAEVSSASSVVYVHFPSSFHSLLSTSVFFSSWKHKAIDTEGEATPMFTVILFVYIDASCYD